MLSIQLKQLAEKLAWQKVSADDLVYGDFAGYRFTVLEGRGFKAILTPVAGISAEGLQALKTWLDENKKQLNLRNYELADNFLAVRLQESWKPRSVEQLEWLLSQLAALLSQFGLPQDACAICGQPADKQGLLHGLYCALHPACQDQATVDFTQEA